MDEDSRAETSGVLKRMNRFEQGINGRWHVVADLFFNWFALFSFFFSLNISYDAILKSEFIFVNRHNY